MPTLEFSFWKGMQHQDSSCKNNTVVMHFKLYLFFFMQFNLLYRFKLHCGTKKTSWWEKNWHSIPRSRNFVKKIVLLDIWYILRKANTHFWKQKQSLLLSSFTTTVYILTRNDIVKKVTQHKSLLKLGQLKPWGVKQGHSFMLCMGEKRRK